MFKDKVIVITGGAHGIGKRIKEDFEKEGYITNAEALKTISVAINSNTEKADLAR